MVGFLNSLGGSTGKDAHLDSYHPKKMSTSTPEKMRAQISAVRRQRQMDF